MIPLAALAIATLGGAAIGLERQWSGHATGPDARFGGLRTFTLLGAIGGIAGGLLAAGWAAVAAVLLAAAAALVSIGYAAKSRHDIDATTEVAAIIVLATGTLAGVGQMALASGIVATTAVLLLEKGRLHALAARLDDAAFRASAQFAVLALVILPLLPSGAYGPFDAVRPRELWALVLFFSGLSFAAWIARRALGPTNGTLAAGAIGGLLSSTSVTFSFSRASRDAEAPRRALALGSVAACTVMLLRVAATSSILNWPVAIAFARYAWPAFATGMTLLALGWRRERDQASDPPPEEGSPLQLRAALQMAAFFQVVMIAISAVIAWWSAGALMMTSAMIGLTDLDALTVSLARTAPSLDSGTAGRALAVGVLANTLLKLGVGVVVGRGIYRLLVGVSLGIVAAAVTAMLVF